jgi:hypothetical protein
MPTRQAQRNSFCLHDCSFIRRLMDSAPVQAVYKRSRAGSPAVRLTKSIPGIGR